MIVHSEAYKNQIKELGRQIDARLLCYKSKGLNTEDDNELYTENNLDLLIEQMEFDDVDETIEAEDIYRLDIIHKGDMLKSYMKELDFEIKQNLSVGDGINVKFGLKVDEEGKDYQFNGKSSQNGTPSPSNPIPIESLTSIASIEIPAGKNIYDYSSFPFARKVAYSNGNMVSWNGYSGTEFYVPVEEETTYTFSNDLDKPIHYGIVFYDENKSVISYINAYTTTFTTPANCKYVRLSIEANPPEWVQIEKGTEATEYKQYITKNCNINIGDIELCSINNYNLFNKDDVVLGKRLDQQGRPFNDSGYYYSSFIKVNPNTNYIKSSPTADAYHRVCFYSSDDETSFISKSEANVFTTPNNCNYIRICGNEHELNATQVELGNVLHSYVPYGSPIPVIYDKIYNDGDNWYIEKNIKKVVLDGTETGWVGNSPATGMMRYYRNFDDIYTFTDQVRHINTTMSNRFVPVATNYVGGMFHYQGQVFFMVNSNDIANVNDWKNWLSNNKLVLYYQLATPIIEQITDGYLLTQLNAIREGYEYLNYGKHVIYSKDYNEDTGTYTYKAYDKMLYAMKPFDLEIEYPITIKDLISMIGDKMGCPIDDVEPINGDKEILSNPYYELNVTYRDVLDDLSAIIGGPICINNDHISVAYINNSGDVIDAEYLKDSGVSFKEKYGPINSLTFTLLDGEDAIVRRDEESISNNGVCNIDIKNNPFLQFENVSDYIDDLFNHLKGIEYYVNDYSSTGITYYDFMDKYNVQVGENIYPCLMLNDEIKIEQGLEENVYTEKPTQATSTYVTSTTNEKDVSFIVDRQNHRITSKVGKDEVISTINQSPEEISIQASKISLEGYTTINNGFSVDLEGNMSCKNASMTGAVVSGGDISLISIGDTNSVFKITDHDDTSCYWHQNARKIRWYGVGTGYIEMGNYHTNSAYISISDNSGSSSTNTTSLTPFVVTTPRVNQTSLEENKKNIELFEGGLEEVLKTDIYKYNLKFEDDNYKKHLGFVIGKDRNYSHEITSIDDTGKENGVDTYSMISLCLQAIKEQQKQIEDLKDKISKGGI